MDWVAPNALKVDLQAGCEFLEVVAPRQGGNLPQRYTSGGCNVHALCPQEAGASPFMSTDTLRAIFYGSPPIYMNATSDDASINENMFESPGDTTSEEAFELIASSRCGILGI